MRFETSSGNAMSARQAWHDAFVTGIRAIDYVELANGAGVQFTAKGSDNCTMDHCDKGLIQSAIEKLRYIEVEDDGVTTIETNPAWAWGMFAYAPDGTYSLKYLQSILLPYVIFKLDCPRTAQYFYMFYRALDDARIEANTDKRRQHDHKLMASALKVSLDDYEKDFMHVFFNMKDELKDLSAQCLPPVATVVHAIVDKRGGDESAVNTLNKLIKSSVFYDSQENDYS